MTVPPMIMNGKRLPFLTFHHAMTMLQGCHGPSFAMSRSVLCYVTIRREDVDMCIEI